MIPFPYRILVERSDRDECFVARIPALKVVTHGDTEEAAASEAKVAADLLLAVMREDGEEPPAPDALEPTPPFVGP
jgi:predicted RNase H-like HicB family nuclease